MTDIWFQKYRPKTLDEYIFPNRQVARFVEDCISNRYIPNLLLAGGAGTGKTTLALLLISELDVSEVLRINASTESGIDTIRDRVAHFCRSFPMDGFKVVLLEEADGLSVNAQRALRVLSEDYTNTVKFIFTCNFPNKIIDPIHSRCQTITVNAMDYDSILFRIGQILDSELGFDKEFSDDEIEAIDMHINSFYPDVRKIINSIQQNVQNNVVHAPAHTGMGTDVSEWESCWSSPKEHSNGTVRSFVHGLLNISSCIDDRNFEQVYQIMYRNVEQLDCLDQDNSAEAYIPIMAEHLYRAYTVADQQMNLDACLYRMITAEG